MITLVGSATAGGFQSSVTVDQVPDVEPGDRLLLFATANDFDVIESGAEGWAVVQDTNIGATTTTWAFTRTVAADESGEVSEPSSYTFTWNGAHHHFLVLTALRGVSHIRTQAGATGAGVHELDAPALAGGRPGDALAVLGFHWAAEPKEIVSLAEPIQVIDNLPRGPITGWLTLDESDGGGQHTVRVTTEVDGRMSATALLLAPEAAPPAPIGRPFALRVELQMEPGEWTDITGDVRVEDDITIERGRRDEASTADASSCGLRLGNPDGRYTPRHPSSPYFGRLRRNTPIRVGVVDTLEEVIWRFAGEVSEWPVRWPLAGTDATVPISAAGPLRRLGQGADPARDALRRRISAGGPLAYWPVTQSGLLRVVPSGVDGGLDMSILTSHGALGLRSAQLGWQEGDLAPHLLDVARTRHADARLDGFVGPGSSQGWAVDMVRAGTGGVDRMVVHTRPDPAGASQQWRYRFLAGDGQVQVHVRPLQDEEPETGFTELGSFAEPGFFAGDAHHVRLSVIPGGSGASWALTVDGEVIGSGSTGAVGAPDPVHDVSYRWTHDDPDDAEHTAVGHITVWDHGTDPPPPIALDVTRALLGHSGERAGVRVGRLAAEEGIVLRTVGDLEDTPAMGPQYPETPLELMRAAEQVDGGVLHEARDEVAMVYRTNRSRYWTGES